MRHVIGVTVLGILSVSWSNDLCAQRNSWRVTTPSPTAASLGKFGDIPVGFYTGTPNISIPLYTAKGRTLGLPIALTYHAGGIKVEEIGGWVGIGWSLSAGGAITRTVRGLFDEDVGRGYYHTGQTWYDPNNWPQVLSSATLANLRVEEIDGEPDQFFFNFAGRSGQFVMGPTSMSGPIEYRAVPHQKLRIEPLFVAGRITQWTITTEDGTRYVFGQAETTTDFTTVSSAQDEGSHWGETYTSSWHLTRIIAPGGDEITLTYAVYNARHQMGWSRSKFDFINAKPDVPCVPSAFDSRPENEIATARLSSIVTAAESIAFIPGALRTDAPSPTGVLQEPTLDRITVATRAGVVLREFQLSYSYATGRLTLAGLAERSGSGDSLPPYTFTYATPALPPRTSLALDHWGYYNGRSNQKLVPRMPGPGGHLLDGADREPDTSKVRAGMLTKITYPTGGYNEFDYEPNDYGSIRGSAITGFVEGPDQAVDAAAGIPAPEPEVVTQEFTISTPIPNDSILVSLEFSQVPTDCGGMETPPCPMTEIVGVGSWQTNGQYQLKLPAGTYTLRATTLASGQEARIFARWRNRHSSPGRIAGGVRIAEIRTGDAMGNVTVRRYKYTLSNEPTRSSGDISAPPMYAFQYSSSGCSYFSRTSMSRMPLGDGPIVGYREVTVWHGPNAEFGKTRHTFRNTADVSDPIPSTWPFHRRTSFEWMRGQETSVIEFDASDRAQRRVATTHTFETSGPTLRSFRGMSIESFSGGEYGTVSHHHAFEVLSAWTYPSQEETVVYDEAGAELIASARTYTYGNPAHLHPTQITETNSDGTQRLTYMKYPADYGMATGTPTPEAAALNAMQGPAHIHSPVIERWVVQRVGTTAHIVEAELTTFREFPGSRFLPYQRFVLNAPSPLP